MLDLLRLRKQTLEASYKRKLDAVVLLLQRRDRSKIEQCGQASLRTVQRWAERARRCGADSLRTRARNCESSTLTAAQHERLATDLKRAPLSLGYTQPIWTAALLTTHIRTNYSISFSLRHCRRLLTTLGVAKRAAPMTSSPKRRLVQSKTLGHHEPVTVPPVGDYARKRRALAAIRRLAGSRMPLQPFVYTLFDLINDGVPHDEASPGLTAAAGESWRWIIRNFDYSRWFPQMQKYLLNAQPEVSGFRPPSLLPQNPLIVLRHEEIVCQNYYRSEGYNEFFRWMGMHHGLLTLLRDEQGNFLGYYPIFRSQKMKPFSRNDVEFLQTAAGYIAEGIRIAGLVTYQSVNEEPFEPFAQVPQGMVVMDLAGKVLSINRAAQSFFRQFAIYDGYQTGFSINGGLSEAFVYIAHQLRVIFGNRLETCIEAQQPIVRIHSHRSGATLRLHGVASDLSEHGGHFTVLIELGETDNLLRQRLSARYNLSHRQAELLMLLRRGAGNRQIADVSIRVRPHSNPRCANYALSSTLRAEPPCANSFASFSPGALPAPVGADQLFTGLVQISR